MGKIMNHCGNSVIDQTDLESKDETFSEKAELQTTSDQTKF